jgi:hypothetical protein
MKVLLSSTALDLQAYRQIADDTILRLSQEVVAMERFGPLPGAPVAECEEKARESYWPPELIKGFHLKKSLQLNA